MNLITSFLLGMLFSAPKQPQEKPVPFLPSKHDLERLDAARAKRERKMAKRAAQVSLPRYPSHKPIHLLD